MTRFLVLATLLSLASPLLADSSTSVKVQTTVVTPRVVIAPDAALAPPERSPRAHARRDLRRRRTHLVTASHHVPRPLSPGEFGRARHGF